MKINRWLVMLCLGCTLFLFACSRETQKPEVPKSVAEPDPGDLVVVATNDFHAALDRAEGLASVIRDLRKRYGGRMVYLDAGDQFQGSLEGNLSKGKAVVEFFNLLGLDAAAVGNHEFDFGPDVPKRVAVQPGEDGMGNLKERVKEAKYPILSANLIFDPPVSCEPGPACNALGQKTVFEPHVMFQRAGKKVCVIGATTPLTKDITNPAFFKGKTFGELGPVILAESKFLREQQRCDWVLLTIHEGMRYEQDGKTLRNTGLLPLLRWLPPSTVDAVVGAHSHIRVQEAIGGTPVIQTGSGGKVVGIIHLSRKAGHNDFRFDPFVSVPDTAVAFDVTSLLMLYRKQALDLRKQVVGVATSTFLLDKSRETALGNLVADALLDAARQKEQAQFSLINDGAFRSNLPQGPVTYDSVFKLMPFDDSLVVVELTGAELRSLLEVAFSGALGTPAISGLRITRQEVHSGQSGPWERDLNSDGRKQEWERNLISDLRDRNGKPLENEKVYKLATISYLVEGGDFQGFVYDRIPPGRIHEYGEIMIRDLLVAYFEKKSPLNPGRYFSPSFPRIRNSS